MADPEKKDGEGSRNPFRRAANKAGALVQKFRQAHFDHALIDAVSAGNEFKTALQLSRGANANAQDGRPLVIAAERGYMEVVEVLLGGGADAKQNESRAFRHAVERGHRGPARLLLQRGADVHARCDHATVICAGHNNIRMMELVLAHGGDPNAQKGAPVIIAVEKNYPHIVRLLLARGAKLEGEADPAFRLASDGRHAACLDVLRGHLAAVRPGTPPPSAPPKP